MPDLPGIEHAISSNETFHLEKLPKRIIIAGGGYIANEFAGIFHQFGSKVTLVNRTDVLLRGYDQQIVDRLIQISDPQGHRLQVPRDDRRDREARGRLAPRPNDRLRRHRDGPGSVCRRTPARTSRVSAAMRRASRSARRARSRSTRTIAPTSPSIFAVGDVTDRVQLTPVAIREGQAFADTFFGKKPHRVDYNCIPSAVFSHPPLAGVGHDRRARRATGSAR